MIARLNKVTLKPVFFSQTWGRHTCGGVVHHGRQSCMVVVGSSMGMVVRMEVRAGGSDPPSLGQHHPQPMCSQILAAPLLAPWPHLPQDLHTGDSLTHHFTQYQYHSLKILLITTIIHALLLTHFINTVLPLTHDQHQLLFYYPVSINME